MPKRLKTSNFSIKVPVCPCSVKERSRFDEASPTAPPGTLDWPPDMSPHWWSRGRTESRRRQHPCRWRWSAGGGQQDFVTIVVKDITYWGFYIYINLGILSLCTELWNGTRSMRILPYMCLDYRAFWWIDGVYRYWMWVQLTPFNYISFHFNYPLILTHAKRSEKYCRA